MNSQVVTPKRIAIIGGPGTGKSTIIATLEKKGYDCMHEISRAVTLQAQSEGIDQLFLTDPILFRFLEEQLVLFFSLHIPHK